MKCTALCQCDGQCAQIEEDGGYTFPGFCFEGMCSNSNSAWYATCWNEENTPNYGFFSTLETTIAERVTQKNTEKSYVASLFAKGIPKVAQKVGEEAVEMVIEAMDNNDALFLYESADLMFHYLMLLQAKGFTLKDIETELKKRQQ